MGYFYASDIIRDKLYIREKISWIQPEFHEEIYQATSERSFVIEASEDDRWIYGHLDIPLVEEGLETVKDKTCYNMIKEFIEIANSSELEM